MPEAAASENRPGRSNVVVVSWVSFVQDLGSEMLYPILPLYLTGVLGAPVAAVGAMEGPPDVSLAMR
jgi:hypothetical protein